MSYLSGNLAWILLFDAAEGSLPSFRVAELKDIDFWPMWGLEGRSRGVEPDVFMTLDLGDPSKRVHVILEAKRGSATQYEYQWRAEIKAWNGELDDSVESAPDMLILLTLVATASARQGRSVLMPLNAAQQL